VVAVLTITAARDSQDGGFSHDARFRHDADHGFCVVCGSVWPCSRADGRADPAAVQRPVVPVPRWPEPGFAY
jgi:hypothetical protein